MGLHQGSVAAILRLPPRARVETLTRHPQAVPLLHSALWAWAIIALFSRVCAAAAPSPSAPSHPSHCDELQRPRPWFLKRSANTHTLDTSATEAANAPVLIHPATVVVPLAPDPRTLLHHCSECQTCWTKGQEGSPQLELSSMSKKGKQEDPSSLCLWGSQQSKPPLPPMGPLQSWPQKIPLVCTNVDLTELRWNEATVLSQEPKTLHPTQPAPAQPPSGKSLSHQSQAEV